MREIAVFDFADLVDGEFDFYGIQGQYFRLDDTTYEAIERDEGSYDVVISDERIEGMPIARVIVEHPAFGDESYAIVDLHDDHEWLVFGACHEEVANDDDPRFCFEYFPKGPDDPQ